MILDESNIVVKHCRTATQVRNVLTPENAVHIDPLRSQNTGWKDLSLDACSSGAPDTLVCYSFNAFTTGAYFFRKATFPRLRGNTPIKSKRLSMKVLLSLFSCEGAGFNLTVPSFVKLGFLNKIISRSTATCLWTVVTE